MDSVWFKEDLSDAIVNGDDIYDKVHNITTDLISGHLDITRLVENMAGALTDTNIDNRVKGMKFFTKILQELPKFYLNNLQAKFISKFYTDRLKDNHRVVPYILEGYLYLVEMDRYEVQNSGEFFTMLFREVPCQSQTQPDRRRIYKLIQIIFDKNVEYIISLGPDFIYGFISAMDGERDPRNLMLLFTFLPSFISQVPLGHLTGEMFEVISCYYPIDFHASPDDPAAVTRQDLADALAPCLCASPGFGESCLILLIEKLDSNLRMAKIDSLKLLTESCKCFYAVTYFPYLKTLWASLHTELSHKTDEDIKLAAHEALAALTKKLATSANTDNAFENFVKGIVISMQTAMAESAIVPQFYKASRILLTVANASKESCELIVNAMIPAAIAYYTFKTTSNFQIASLTLLGELTDSVNHWKIGTEVESLLEEIPNICLTAVKNEDIACQIAGFKTLNKIQDYLSRDIILPFVEVLINNVQAATDENLIITSVETVHALARKHPEIIMETVVKGKCDLDNLTANKTALKQRLDLLCNLASIDDFTKVIMEEMLNIISTADKNDARKVVHVMNTSISNVALYPKQKIAQIESDHGLIDSIISWLLTEISSSTSQESLDQGYSLISNTIGSLNEEKQLVILEKHTDDLIKFSEKQETYFLLLYALYNSLRQSIYTPKFSKILNLSLKFSIESQQEILRNKGSALVAHFINKVEYGDKFDSLYQILKNNLTKYSTYEDDLCPNLITLCGFLAKGLILRGSDLFIFWLKKVKVALANPKWCAKGAEAMRLITAESPDYLNAKCHCRTTFLYKQRMFLTFMQLTENFDTSDREVKQAYLLSWAYLLQGVPKTVLYNEVDKITPLVMDSLSYDNKDLLVVMTEVLAHIIKARHGTIENSLQTLLPRLVNLTKYAKSMDVRIKSLECLSEIANVIRTSLLLPHKQDILYDLAPSLDDNKRLVRNMAVRARTRWFLIGAPGEAKQN